MFPGTLLFLMCRGVPSITRGRNLCQHIFWNTMKHPVMSVYCRNYSGERGGLGLPGVRGSGRSRDSDELVVGILNHSFAAVTTAPSGASIQQSARVGGRSRADNIRTGHTLRTQNLIR